MPACMQANTCVVLRWAAEFVAHWPFITRQTGKAQVIRPNAVFKDPLDMKLSLWRLKHKKHNASQGITRRTYPTSCEGSPSKCWRPRPWESSPGDTTDAETESMYGNTNENARVRHHRSGHVPSSAMYAARK